MSKDFEDYLTSKIGNDFKFAFLVWWIIKGNS